jgi:hypothetical protein
MVGRVTDIPLDAAGEPILERHDPRCAIAPVPARPDPPTRPTGCTCHLIAARTMRDDNRRARAIREGQP